MSLLAVAENLLALAAVFAVVGVSAGVGRVLLRRLGMDPRSGIEELLFSIALGTGAVSAIYLVQGFLGVLQPAAVWATLAVLGAAARRDLRGVAGTTAGVARGLARRLRADPWAWGALGVFLVTGTFFLVQGLAPPTDWDSLMYHLEIPGEFLERGRIFLPLDNLHVTRVGVIHLLYLPLLAVGSTSGPAMLNAAMALLLGVGVVAYGRRFLGPGSGLLGGVLLWGTSTILLVAITARIDVTLALFALLAVHSLLQALTRAEPGPPYVLSGALLGLCVGIKFTGLVVGAAAAPLALWVCWRRWEGRHRLRALGAFAGTSLLVAGVWLVKNMILLGAPLYPVLVEPVVQPWLAEILGGRALPTTVDPAVLDFIWRLREPFDLTAAFLDPGSLVVEYEGRWYYTAPALAFLVLAVFHLRRRMVLWSTLTGALYVTILLVAFPRSNLRYFLPAVPILTVVTADALLRSLRRLERPLLTRTVLGLVVALNLLPPAVTATRWLSGTRALEALVDDVGPTRYMASHHLPSVQGLAPVLRYANTSLPSDATLLMLVEARSFPFEVEVLQDVKATNWLLLAASSAPERCLANTGISHVLLGKATLDVYVNGGLDPGSLGFEGRFRTFARRCLEPLYEDQSYTLYSVEAPRSGETR